MKGRTSPWVTQIAFGSVDQRKTQGRLRQPDTLQVLRNPPIACANCKDDWVGIFLAVFDVLVRDSQCIRDRVNGSSISGQYMPTLSRLRLA
ncbi:MAG: hypothetical protein VXZ15_14850, partial [Planctomycetota bacterium]|nr:hypothetical protein [Planctomycetota bacterium]